MQTVYHVTLTENLVSIFDKGLEPQVGRLSSMVGDAPGVYVFSSENDLIENVSNWMWHHFTEDQSLTALEITLPDEFPLQQISNWEMVSKNLIEPKYIKFFMAV